MKASFCIFFSFYFLIGSAFPQGDFAQLMHIPDAVHHFREHMAEARFNDELFSIWSFVQDHYSNPDSHSHEDTDSHDSLPLQHVHSSVIMVQVHVQYFAVTVLTPHIGHEISFDPLFYSGDFQSGIYHPPIRS